MHVQTFLRIFELDIKIIESEKWLMVNIIFNTLIIYFYSFFFFFADVHLFIHSFVLLQNLYDKPPSYSSLRPDSNMEAMKLQQILLKKDNQVCTHLFFL